MPRMRKKIPKDQQRGKRKTSLGQDEKSFFTNILFK